MKEKVVCSKYLSNGIENTVINLIVRKYRNHLMNQKGADISEKVIFYLKEWLKDKVEVKVVATCKVNIGEIDKFVSNRVERSLKEKGENMVNADD